MTTLTLRQIGNSVGFGVPKSMLEQLGLAKGSKINVDLVGNELVVKPARKKYDINELVKGMNPENQDAEMFADSVGEELL